MIFIDANIYLRFYDSNHKLFKKLLDYLLEVKEDIFITRQVVDEVNRNKLIVFNKSISNYKVKMKLETVKLPEHFTSTSNSFDIVEWNKKRAILKEQNDQLLKDLEYFFNESLDKICSSEDIVSKSLINLFGTAIIETDEEIIEARIRKEIGNPPGKNNDCLGDQISWTQILNNAQNTKNLWVISNDFDYFTKYNKNLYLNPFLLSELHKKNPTIKVNCFNELSIGLDSYFKECKHIDFLSKEQVNKISHEEKQYRTNISSSNISAVGYNEKNKVLEIEFNHGGVYQYFDVPADEYESLMNASSLGLYFSHNIRNDYDYEKL